MTWAARAECPCGFSAAGPTVEGVAELVRAHRCPPARRRWWDAIDWDLAWMVLPIALLIVCVSGAAIFGADQ